MISRTLIQQWDGLPYNGRVPPLGAQPLEMALRSTRGRINGKFRRPRPPVQASRSHPLAQRNPHVVIRADVGGLVSSMVMSMEPSVLETAIPN